MSSGFLQKPHEIWILAQHISQHQQIRYTLTSDEFPIFTRQWPIIPYLILTGKYRKFAENFIRIWQFSAHFVTCSHHNNTRSFNNWHLAWFKFRGRDGCNISKKCLMKYGFWPSIFLNISKLSALLHLMNFPFLRVRISHFYLSVTYISMFQTDRKI